jgi:hypothetical protein
MKTAKAASKKIVKVAQPRRVAGVPVRSGVKAGWEPGRGKPGKPFHDIG